MKNRFFKFIKIDQDKIKGFVARHPQLSKYVDVSKPFHVRVSRKPFPGLIHTVISQDNDSQTTATQWNQLNDFVKIKAKKILKLPIDKLEAVVGKQKAQIIKQISQDFFDWVLDFRLLGAKSEKEIIDWMSKYEGLTVNTIKTFLIFVLFKQNVLCETDPDFLLGLKVFLQKENIVEQDIENIKSEYNHELTLFSLCMWKIRNERSGK